ncbi:ATP-grasp domain-containing protein [Saccharomonospora xinjiangensis]|uniref:ATP-grasp domain-containing protein n=1 Tax=Saccharomonospora xinjiangensis TaxID=75294 RepID=UPI00106F6CE4|nr:ATP-grasp domain-containing protein [Saccharomonospora xinjiangensis]QBQ62484.1 argininosuccinate lyase [Saccharomonospora xinjiangensis]
MRRTLVVLGGADGSVGVYRRARELGYRTICVDIRPGAPGVAAADEYLQLSVRAPERIDAALRSRTDIAGVICPASDVGLPTQAWLAKAWDLPSPLPDAAVEASVDKPVFRAVCERAGVPTYRSVSGTSGPELARAARGMRFPALVKPVDSSGSRGVISCSDPGKLGAIVAESLTFSHRGRVVVEEHLDGRHLTIEAIVADGDIAFHAVTERTITPPPLFVTTAHAMPADLPEDVAESLPGMLAAVCAEIGYRDGPLTFDAVLTRDGVLYLIEMGARMGGNGIAEVVESCHGVDLMAATMAQAVGEKPVLTPKPPMPSLVHILASDRMGRLAAIEGTDEVRALPEVVDLQLFVQGGSPVQPYEQAGYKLGYVVLTADSPERLRAVESEVRGTLKFRLEPQGDEKDMAVPLP